MTTLFSNSIMRSLITVAAGMIITSTSYAQRIVPSDADTSRMRVPIPLPRLPEFDLRIQTPERAATPRAVDEIEFLLKGVRFEGGGQYTETEMTEIFKTLLGKRITLESFREKAQALENLYRKDGYFLTRVLIPPQQVKDGIFTIQIIEGFISETFVEGAEGADRQFVELLIGRLRNKKPIDLSSLEHVLLLLNDIPSAGGTGTLRPGAAPGSSELVVTLSPPPKISTVLGFNNTASRTIGPWGFSVNSSLPRPFGRLGTLGIGLSNSLSPADRLHAIVASYSTPVGHSGTLFSLGGLTAVARPGGSLASLNVLSESWSISPRLRKPLLRSVKESWFVDAGLSINKTKAFINDGTDNKQAISHDRTSVLELGLSYQQIGILNGNTQFGVSIFQGVDILGALSQDEANTPSTQGFKQRFGKQTLTLYRQQNLSRGWTLILLAQGQHTNDLLLSGDQAFYGGMTIGRGYDSGALFGDRGFGGLSELRWDIPKFASHKLADNLSIQTFVAYDFARATRLANPASGTAQTTSSIASTAIGLRIRDTQGLSVEAMIANANTFVASNDRKSDPRVLFTLTKIF